MTPGALIAVCGVHPHAPTATVSRILAAELARRPPPGTVLLTAARDLEALHAARSRHRVVIADVGVATADTANSLASASAVIFVFRGTGGSLSSSARAAPARCRNGPQSNVAGAVSCDASMSWADIREIVPRLGPRVRGLAIVGAGADAASPPIADGAALIRALS